MFGESMLMRGVQMNIFTERFVETVVDRVCDVCKESVMTDVGGGDKIEEYGELKAQWATARKLTETHIILICARAVLKLRFSL
jgi:hypothetical protein